MNGHIVTTEQGLADSRGVGPRQRASMIIEKYAYPIWREYFAPYAQESRLGHIRHDHGRCFKRRRHLLGYGAMLPHRRWHIISITAEML